MAPPAGVAHTVPVLAARLRRAGPPVGRAMRPTTRPTTHGQEAAMTSRAAIVIERLRSCLATPIHWAAELIADRAGRTRPRATRARFIRALRRAARATLTRGPASIR
jgi:hypothetical protein